LSFTFQDLPTLIAIKLL